MLHANVTFILKETMMEALTRLWILFPPLKAFCFTGKFCRLCLPAINENDRSYRFLLNLFFQVRSQCSVTVGSKTGGPCSGQEGSRWIWHWMAHTCCPLPVSDGFCCGSTFLPEKHHTAFNLKVFFCAEKGKGCCCSPCRKIKGMQWGGCLADPLLRMKGM